MKAEELPSGVPLGKVLVVVDIPKELMAQYRITDEEINEIVKNSIFMVVKMVDELIEKKKGKEKKEKDKNFSDIYS